MSLDKPIDKFIEDQKSKNTLSKTRRDVSLLTKYLNSKNESRRIEEIPPKELNEYINEFIVAVRRKDGEDFEPSSLRGLICSVNRHLKACNILAVLLKTRRLPSNASSACLNRQTKTALRGDKLNFIGFTNFEFVSFVISIFN